MKQAKKWVLSRLAHFAFVLPVAVVMLLGVAATPARAITISDLTITESTIGTAQITLNTQFRPRRIFFGPSILLPAGDPFSSASISMEFTILDVTGADSLLHASLSPLTFTEVSALSPGPVPWDVSVTLVRLDQPSVIFAGNEADTQTTSSIDGFEWADEAFHLPMGRYRYTVQASQVGGEVRAGVSSVLRLMVVPEPSAALVFVVGLAIAGQGLRSRSSP